MLSAFLHMRSSVAATQLQQSRKTLSITVPVILSPAFLADFFLLLVETFLGFYGLSFSHRFYLTNLI